ncbi:MAG: hypothetical protein K2O59_00490 [Lachnospiraceae bacterium]|nr:hypothetical protein [Lachnospiraceae bacterium]
MKLRYSRVLVLLLLLLLVSCASGEKHDAYRRGGVNLFIDGEKYIETEGLYKESYKKICKTSDGFALYEVVGDKERNYVVCRAYWDARLFVKESYTPDRTVVSAVCFGGNRDYIYDEEIIDCVLSLESNEDFFNENDDMMESRDKEKVIYIMYGDEAVGERVGYVFLHEEQYMYYSCSKRMVTVLTDDQRDLIQEYLL